MFFYMQFWLLVGVYPLIRLDGKVHSGAVSKLS